MGDTLNSIMEDAIDFAVRVAAAHPNFLQSRCFGGACSLSAEAETAYLQFGPKLALEKGIYKNTSHDLPVSRGRQPGLYMDSLLTGEPSVTFKVNDVELDSFKVKKIRFIEAADLRLGVPKDYNFNAAVGFDYSTTAERVEPTLQSIPKETPFALTVTASDSSHIVICAKSEDDSLHILDNDRLFIIKPNAHQTLTERLSDFFTKESPVKVFFENGIHYWQVIQHNYPDDYHDSQPTTCTQ